MGWLITTDAGEFFAMAVDFLRWQAVENTVLLSVAENERVHATAEVMARAMPGRATGAEAVGRAGTASADSALFGWWRVDTTASGGTPGSGTGLEVTGAFVHTPGHPLVLSEMSAPVAAGLAEDLAGAGCALAGVNGSPEAATSFAARWREASGSGAGIVSRVHRHMRLFRLAELTPPAPPPGRARTATASDRALLAEWSEAFAREVDDIGAARARAAVDDRLAYGGFMLWETAGRRVSLAGLTRAVAGTAAFAAMIDWLANFALIEVFPVTQNAISLGGVMVVFAGLCALAIVFVWKFLPETKGLPVEEIIQVFERQQRSGPLGGSGAAASVTS